MSEAKRQSPGKEPSAKQKRHVEELLDEGLEESFPASDPPAVATPHPPPETDSPDDDGKKRKGS